MPAGPPATPIDTVVSTGPSSTAIPELANASRTRSATTTASSSEQVSNAANSSPPIRPDRSVIRSKLITMVANNLRISSPAGWPKRSLIDLKWSMSKISTVTGRPAIASRSITRDVASAKPRRLNMPVSGSIDAAVLCTVTVRSDTRMKMTNEVSFAVEFMACSTENIVTQMLPENIPPFACNRSPSRIGSISAKPCATGTAIAGQRACIVLRRSDHNSAAVSPA